MNPLGLLIAYAEAKVMPVVSDFDTFLVGSFGPVEYQSVPDDQVDIALWALNRTDELLNEKAQGGWTARWLNVLKIASAKGFHPTIPKFGFGDPTSRALIEKVVHVCEGSGAIRHGAECFNYFFPQEMDDEFLVVWDGLEKEGVRWKPFSEKNLRQFLMARIDEGYAFPLNPCWPIRDDGWYDVYDKLRQSPQCQVGCKNFESWYPHRLQEQIDKYYHGRVQSAKKGKKKSTSEAVPKGSKKEKTVAVQDADATNVGDVGPLSPKTPRVDHPKARSRRSSDDEDDDEDDGVEGDEGGAEAADDADRFDDLADDE